MKHTAKYNAAVKTAAKVLPGEGGWDNATLYDHLEKKGWFWNAESGEWEDFRRSTSMFESDAGLPTGEFRLRLMCHPGDLDRLLELVNEALDTYGVAISEQSNPYPNRRGPGIRCYLTGKLPDPKKVRKHDD